MCHKKVYKLIKRLTAVNFESESSICRLCVRGMKSAGVNQQFQRGGSTKKNMCYNLVDSFQPFQQFVSAILWVEGNKRLLCCGKQRNITSNAVTDVSESIFWQGDFTHHISTLNLLQWLILMPLFPSSPSPLYFWVGILFTIEEYNKYWINFSVSNSNLLHLDVCFQYLFGNRFGIGKKKQRKNVIICPRIYMGGCKNSN